VRWWQAGETRLGLNGAEGERGLPVFALPGFFAHVDHVGVQLGRLYAALGAVGVGGCLQSLRRVHYINKAITC